MEQGASSFLFSIIQLPARFHECFLYCLAGKPCSKVLSPKKFTSDQWPHLCRSSLAGWRSWFFFLLFAGAFRAVSGKSDYTNNGVAATISNPGQPTNAFVQVTIYQVTGLSQQEQSFVMHPVSLNNGDNKVFIPLHLQPGTYKLNMYLIQDGERKTAVIRDIVV